MTNNPQKMKSLLDEGIDVVERIPLHGKLNAHNEKYLSTKRDQLGHLLRQGLEELH